MKLDRDNSTSRKNIDNIKHPQSKYIKNVMSIPNYMKDKNGIHGLY